MSDVEFTSTANGAVALKSTGDTIVDFFMLFSRTISQENIDTYMDLCWNINPIKTVAIIFNGRDRKSGKKEKTISNKGMIWLRNNKPLTYKGNIFKYIEKYGCWKDIMYINFNVDKRDFLKNMKYIAPNYELNVIAEQLKKDKVLLDNDNCVSLCAKWAPSENDKYDRRKKSALKIAELIFPNENKKMEKYRKEYLTPLRKKIKIVETLMCDNRWTDINYEEVPAIASNRLKKAFMKHDPEGYGKFLSDVKNGEKSIKVTGILPHELVKYYLEQITNYYRTDCLIDEVNETIEMQWKTLVNEVKQSGVFDGLLAIVDVSGSMFSASNGSVPAQVAIALGLLISECSSGNFHNKIITFSNDPVLHTVVGETLCDKINNVRRLDAGTSTNFEATSDLIIKYGKDNNISQENMPKKLVCLTDMQFNQANIGDKYTAGYRSYNEYLNNNISNTIETLHRKIIKKYEQNNYKAPAFIYWNLSSDTKEIFPVSSSEEGTAVISGFSEQLLKVFMKYDNFTPLFIVDEILAPYMLEVFIDKSENSQKNKNNDENPISSTIASMFERSLSFTT